LCPKANYFLWFGASLATNHVSCSSSLLLHSFLHQTRYQIHTTEVTAVDFADDGSTVVSGALDGRVIVWSHLTGFKLAVITLHSAAVRSVSFNAGRLAGASCMTISLHVLLLLHVCCRLVLNLCLLLLLILSRCSGYTAGYRRRIRGD
jgi:WD40 repeat protein